MTATDTPTEHTTAPRADTQSRARLRLVTVEQAGYVAEGAAIRFPQDAGEIARQMLAHKDREHFLVLHLDGAHRVVSAETVSIGTLSSALVHPREVFKAAILSNAAAIIAAHNHPSGDLNPSREDHLILDRLRKAGTLLGIPMLDFLIVSAEGTWSAVDRGSMNSTPQA